MGAPHRPVGIDSVGPSRSAVLIVSVGASRSAVATAEVCCLRLGRGTGRGVVGAHGGEHVGVSPVLLNAKAVVLLGLLLELPVDPPAADGHTDDPGQENTQRGEGRERRHLVDQAADVQRRCRTAR